MINHNEITIDRLYYFLRKKNITISRLADLTGIRQSTLSNLVNRKSVPKIDMLFKICTALDITVVEFLSISPYRNNGDIDSDHNLQLNEKQLAKLEEFINSIRE